MYPDSSPNQPIFHLFITERWTWEWSSSDKTCNLNKVHYEWFGLVDCVCTFRQWFHWSSSEGGVGERNQIIVCTKSQPLIWPFRLGVLSPKRLHSFLTCYPKTHFVSSETQIFGNFYLKTPNLQKIWEKYHTLRKNPIHFT